MSKKAAISKVGNTTKLKYKNGTVVEIRVTKSHDYSKLADLNDLSGKKKKRTQKRRRLPLN
jgi:uncharacterized protein YfkK (UPF0435 family)